MHTNTAFDLEIKFTAEYSDLLYQTAEKIAEKRFPVLPITIIDEDIIEAKRQLIKDT